MPRLTVSMPLAGWGVAELSVRPVRRVMALPLSVYVLPAMVIELKAVLAVKSLAGEVRAVPPGKTRSSPACGAMLPTQLAGLVQLLLPPAPLQMSVDRRVRSSRNSRYGRKEDRRAIRW